MQRESCNVPPEGGAVLFRNYSALEMPTGLFDGVKEQRSGGNKYADDTGKYIGSFSWTQQPVAYPEFHFLGVNLTKVLPVSLWYQ